MNEFSAIRTYLAPLAKNFSGSLNLSDDAAILDIPTGQQLIVTKDAISENVHYLAGTDPALIARKLLRTNLSDLASMGATPLCYFLAIAAPLSEEFISRFAAGLAEDQKEFGIHLAGGDTISSATPTFSLTAHGLVPKGQALLRSGAKIGDAIYVSGTLGDSALGLSSLRAKRGNPDLSLSKAWIAASPAAPRNDDYLVQRYHLPQPRLALGQSLRTVATSCIDISDGLLADLGHIAKASNVGAEIHLESLPLSNEAKIWLEKNPNDWPLIYAGGDDYELCFTLPENQRPPAGTTKIGTIIQGSSVHLLNQGKEITPEKAGYSHSS